MCLSCLCDILVSQLLLVTNNVFLVTDIVLWSPDHVNNIMWTLKILSYICHPICLMLLFPVQLKDKMIILLLNKIFKVLVLLWSRTGLWQPLWETDIISLVYAIKFAQNGCSIMFEGVIGIICVLVIKPVIMLLKILHETAPNFVCADAWYCVRRCAFLAVCSGTP